MEKINTKEIEKYNWRFLLLDDKIDENKESGRLSSSDPSIILTKPQIIKERIDEMGLSCSVVLAEGKKNELPTIQGNEKIQIVCVDTIDRAIELMKQYKFDIVLLDYLLEDSFGYELLKLLKEGDTRTKDVLVGPQNKNFFMFISAFTTAVNERLALEGLSRDESFWSIGEGACPTSTPALFKYRLAHLMGRRLEQTGINYLSEDYIFETILKIFKDSSTNNSSERIPVVRKRAYEAYRNVLGMHYDYSMLKKDQSSSVLVDSFMKNKVHMGSMLEHLLQLVHLTAFGTVRQWPEIWEEYKFFTRSIDGVDDQKIKSLSESIEDYIIVLKSV